MGVIPTTIDIGGEYLSLGFAYATTMYGIPYEGKKVKWKYQVQMKYTSIVLVILLLCSLLGTWLVVYYNYTGTLLCVLSTPQIVLNLLLLAR